MGNDEGLGKKIVMPLYYVSSEESNEIINRRARSTKMVTGMNKVSADKARMKSKPIIVNGKKYLSVNAAAISLGCSTGVINKKVDELMKSHRKELEFEVKIKTTITLKKVEE